MRQSTLLTALVGLALLAGCTGEDGDPAAGETTEGEVRSEPDGATSASTPSASPSPSPSASSPAGTIGVGTVTVNGTELPVSGDCDISRSFGRQPVRSLDDEVDVLLALDNLTGSGEAVGAFALTVRLLGTGGVEGERITSTDRDDTGREVTWEGEVTSARLQDRRRLEFLDLATLHLQATQRAEGAGAPNGTRDLVVEVTCAVSRPG